MADFLPRAGQTANKDIRCISKKLCGKNAPSLRHSYSNSFSFFKSAADKRPIFTFNADGEYDIPLFKLIMIILGAVSAMAFISFAAKKIATHKKKRFLKRLERNGYCTYGNCEDLPF